MLGMKPNRNPIKGEFANILREQIAIAQMERQAVKTQAQAKSSVESKK